MTSIIVYGALLIFLKIYKCDVPALSNGKFDENKNVTNSHNAISCERNACVEKCCPFNKFVYKPISNGKFKSKIKFECIKYDTNVTLDFDDFMVYNEDRTKMLSSINRTLHIVPNKFKNTTFLMNSLDFTKFSQSFNEILYLTEQGNLYKDMPNFYNRWYKIDAMNFCIDYFINRNSDEKPSVHVWIHIPEGTTSEEGPVKYYQIYANLLTCFFLLLVFLVYVILPSLHNLGGMITMAYVFCLFWAYVTLYINQNHKVTHCFALALATYFFFMTSFCWMNVMSFDIWWTFRSYYKSRSINHRGERKRFINYCLYAYGLPLIMTVGVGIANTLDLRDKPWIVLPNIKKTSCFLDDGSKYLYLYIPMIILISMNWFFFLMTAFNVWSLSRGTKLLHVPDCSGSVGHRQLWFRFIVYLKLFIVMGLSWVFEILSYKYSGYLIWEISDIYNIFIGLAIFIIFVVKKKIYVQLKSRLKSCGRSNNLGLTNQSTRNVTSNFIINNNFEPVSSNTRRPESQVKL